MSMKIRALPHRSVLKLTGPERVDFLNGLVTNVVAGAKPGQAVYAGLLTPQGKVLFDLLIFADADALYLDVERERAPDLLRRLTMYKLRADVTIDDMAETLQVFAANSVVEGALVAPDPRHSALGYRVLASEAPEVHTWPEEDYERTRIKSGVPDGSRDIALEKYFWPETNAEAHNGTSYTKGCYVGQELVSRLKHRTEVKKLILPATIDGGAPEHGTDILTDDGKRAGSVLTSVGEDALVYMRLEYRDRPLVAGGHTVKIAA